MSLFSEVFVWWGGNTWGTRWDTWRHGKRVGEDSQGNVYYIQRKGIGPLGKPRRWVVYKSYAESSQIPPGWHGWMHHTVDMLPTDETYHPRPWQKPHRANMTGTPQAYRPAGSILASGKRAASDSDYEPWQPK